MTSTTKEIRCRFAGSRFKTCCGRLAGCACRRPDSGIASNPKHYSGNYLIENSTTKYFKFNRCSGVGCKIKCRENNLVLPLNNFRSNFNDRSYSILTNEDLNCRTKNVVYLVTCTVCKLQYIGETSRFLFHYKTYFAVNIHFLAKESPWWSQDGY